MNGIELNNSVLEEIAKAMWDSYCEGEDGIKWNELNNTTDLKQDWIKAAKAGIERYLRLIELSEMGI